MTKSFKILLLTLTLTMGLLTSGILLLSAGQVSASGGISMPASGQVLIQCLSTNSAFQNSVWLTSPASQATEIWDSIPGNVPTSTAPPSKSIPVSEGDSLEFKLVTPNPPGWVWYMDPAQNADSAVHVHITPLPGTSWQLNWEDYEYVLQDFDDLVMKVTFVPAVGGTAFSPDKLALLAPYIILAALMTTATVSVAVYWRRRQ
jgi:hypothetical protein